MHTATVCKLNTMLQCTLAFKVQCEEAGHIIMPWLTNTRVVGCLKCHLGGAPPTSWGRGGCRHSWKHLLHSCAECQQQPIFLCSKRHGFNLIQHNSLPLSSSSRADQQSLSINSAKTALAAAKVRTFSNNSKWMFPGRHAIRRSAPMQSRHQLDKLASEQCCNQTRLQSRYVNHLDELGSEYQAATHLC